MVGFCGRREHDGINAGVLERIVERRRDRNARRQFRRTTPSSLRRIAYQCEVAELMEVAYQVLAPVTAAENGNRSFRHE